MCGRETTEIGSTPMSGYHGNILAGWVAMIDYVYGVLFVLACGGVMFGE